MKFYNNKNTFDNDDTNTNLCYGPCYVYTYTYIVG